MQIMDAGGGIMSTVRDTRAALVDELVAQTRPRLERMLAHGTTSVEIKTGYGLNIQDELKQLQAVRRLQEESRATLVPTFLGAHAIPSEYKGRTGEYAGIVVDEMLPAMAEEDEPPSFCDVFCEDGAFSLEQSRRILESARALGFGLKIHADEFKTLGGVTLAVELAAVSADHLDVTPQAEIEALAGAPTVGVVLPAVNFNLGDSHFADARTMIDTGVALALATDINPGSAPCPSIPLVMGIACRYQRLLPAEALNASTINAAYAVGLGDRVGSIEVGKRADLIVVNGDVVENIAALRRTELVFKAGVGYDSRRLFDAVKGVVGIR